ncbi:MAG: ABC transporter permease [Ignavibacteria bacterium]|jgi:lipoprotein-releasing system permease protein|nr:ABC transporter permease [Ignavibacteria bacterium]MCU7501606.1 ABC transporter permease [Ignavibacteria bacterium]MCU7517143.1 ABC transporter permease [Ignavibacteria bacterium]
MKYELFIAKRYLRSKHKLNFITIISIVSVLGITLGVAALIVVLSVFNGFGSLVTSILVNFDPHVRITALSEEAYDRMPEIAPILGRTAHIKSYSPFVSGKAIALKNQLTSIVDVKGIDYNTSQGENWGVGSKVEYGSFDYRPVGDKDGIIIGFNLANKIQSLVGDSLYLTSFNSISQSASSLAVPSVKKYVIKGIFESNNNDYDLYSVFVSLNSAQDLLGTGGRFQGYEIRLDDIKNSMQVKNELLKSLDGRLYRINTWYDLHKDLYSMMQIERWAAFIIVSLIITVATFNVLGSLSMSVIEKTKDIGVLRSMGAKDASILRIFMFEGMLTGIIGTIAGSLIGVLIIFLQMKLKFYPLDPTKYIIDALPVELRLWDLLAVAIMALLLSFLASLYPAKKAVKIPALEAIKWE